MKLSTKLLSNAEVKTRGVTPPFLRTSSWCGTWLGRETNLYIT